MNNEIETKSISEFLDGRVFVIPSYQRGYRWENKQVEDLLSDIYEFALKPKSKGDGRCEFYCLQPVIVQKVQNNDLYKGLLEQNEISSDNIWTVIDGQQRFTSIFILFKYLLFEKFQEKGKEKMQKRGRELYHMIYETRVEDIPFLEQLSEDTLAENNIDQLHISNAYKEIENWITTKAPEISRRYKRSDDRDDIIDTLYKLLNCGKDVEEETGSVQVIWYELKSELSKDPISEFLNINNGKIRLTDTELIKALFLRRNNFSTASEKDIKQIEIALQWEQIENRLHRNDFWTFLSNETECEERITILFNLVYRMEKGKEPEDGALFRSYYAKFDGQTTALNSIVRKEWGKIISRFRTMEDWYEDPEKYNYIGLLIKIGVPLKDIFAIYDSLNEDSSTEDFIRMMKEKIKKELTSKVKRDNEELLLDFNKHKNLIRNLLLFLNIEHQNRQIMNIRLQQEDNSIVSPVYKFPFDLFMAQSWDVEHIDSFTPNKLNKKEAQIEWIQTAMADLEDMTEGNKTAINKLVEEEKYSEAIVNLKLIAGEDDEEEDKNSIGNLTLLDSSTNRSYGNSLFPTKRRIILEKQQHGTYIPYCTMMVFSKSFDRDGTKRTKWGTSDKQSYQKYIYQTIINFENSVN
ncbi:MAG: DUF262 domain-containing HNH endonuclease family protein [Paludibacteraceae bacterium]|nr:DUF262 domain-containing HNH endonuclease family protein [Paludibacteraceae bacterium]